MVMRRSPSGGAHGLSSHPSSVGLPQQLLDGTPGWRNEHESSVWGGNGPAAGDRKVKPGKLLKNRGANGGMRGESRNEPTKDTVI